MKKKPESNLEGLLRRGKEIEMRKSLSIQKRKNENAIR